MKKASVISRIVAALLDNFFTSLLSIPSFMLFIGGFASTNLYLHNPDGYAPAVPYFVAATVLYLLPLIYMLIKDGLGKGQSFGKRIVGIKVIRTANQSNCTKGTSALRTLIGFLILSIPFVGIFVEFLMVVTTPDGRRLADKAAGTMVVAA